MILDAVLPAIRLAQVVGFCLLGHPNQRLDAFQFRQRVGIDRRCQRNDARDITHRVEKIQPFGYRKFWRLAMGLPEHLIRPNEHVQLAELGGFFQEPQMPRSNVVKTAGDDDLSTLTHDLALRTLIWNAPGTGRSETMYKYPPPQPEYIAP